MTAYIENPHGREVIPRLPAGSEPSKAAKYIREGVTKGLSMPAPVARGLLARFGWPTMLIGGGVFARVFEDPEDTATVIKITSDQFDGETAARIHDIQVTEKLDPEGIVTATPVLFQVNRVTYKRTDRRDGVVWVMVVEKAIPMTALVDMMSSGPNGATMRAIVYEVHEHFQAMRPVQREVFKFVAGHRTYKDIPPPMAGEMHEELTSYAEKLRSSAKNLPVAVPDMSSKIFNALADAVEKLLEYDIAVIDLHEGNWGFRLHEEKAFEPVVIDFGLSSPGPGERKYTELEPEAPGRKKRGKVAAGQLTLFNPEDELGAWFKEEHPDSYAVARWITEIGGKLVGWFDDGTPTIKSDMGCERILSLFPVDRSDESGIVIHIIARDCELLTISEDWLSGCIPSDFYELAKEAAERGEIEFADPYELPEVERHCERAMRKTRDRKSRELAKDGWRLVLDQPYTDRASRFAWVRERR